MWDRDDPNGLSHLLALFVQSIKTTCTFSEVNLEATGKDKYKLIASRSVVCATKDFPVNKNEGRKEAFGKTVRLITADKQKRKLLWDAYRVSHKNEAMIIINKIIDYIKKERRSKDSWFKDAGDIGCPVCGKTLHVEINEKMIRGRCSSDNCLTWNILA